MSHLEETLAQHFTALRLPTPVREYRWAAAHVGEGKGLRDRLAAAGLKDWRGDFCWPDVKLAVEAEGGGWSGGRHTRGAGFSADLAKYHHAMRLGWTVYRCDARLIRSGEAAQLVATLLAMLTQRPPTSEGQPHGRTETAADPLAASPRRDDPPFDCGDGAGAAA